MTFDLFGRPEKAPGKGRSQGRRSTGSQPGVHAPRFRPSTGEPVATNTPAPKAADVTSFEALGASVCLDIPGAGEVWLVPDYTPAARPEVSAADLLSLVSTIRIFPGARVARFTDLRTTSACPGSSPVRSE